LNNQAIKAESKAQPFLFFMHKEEGDGKNSSNFNYSKGLLL